MTNSDNKTAERSCDASPGSDLQVDSMCNVKCLFVQ
jgi:hypothetical protein